MRYDARMVEQHDSGPEALRELRTSAERESASSPGARLRAARELAGFASASAAARAFSWGQAAYRHHENGTRSYSISQAIEYGKAFSVSPSWLLQLGGISETFRVPLGRFYISAYASEIGEGSQLWSAVDDVFSTFGQVLIPELTITAHEIRWIKQASGLPPLHFVNPSDLAAEPANITDGYLFACRSPRFSARAQVPSGSLLIVDSSVGDVGTTPELWLMRDEDGIMVTWARLTPAGEALLLPAVAGEPAFSMSEWGGLTILGKVIRMTHEP